MDRVSDVKSIDRRPERGDLASRLSMWTVIGAVCASVATAGILGSASGILQIPMMSSDIATLRQAKDDYAQRFSVLSERTKSTELTNESLQRQLNQAVSRMDQLQALIDKRDQDDKTQDLAMERAIGELDMRLSRQISEVEGRSKDRNTEAMGATHAVDTAQAGLQERLKATGDALNALRQIVYDLAIRSTTQTGPQRQSAPGMLQSPSDPFPSPKRNAFRPEGQQAPNLLVDASVRSIVPAERTPVGREAHVGARKKSYSEQRAHSRRRP